MQAAPFIQNPTPKHLPQASACAAHASMGFSDNALREVAAAGWQTVFHDVVDSTNKAAQRLIAQGSCCKTGIVAHRQTAGYGRSDHTWESSPLLGLWTSLVLPVAVPLELLPQSTLVLGVAVRDAVEHATGIALRVKWPNDLLFEGRKCCGMLVETGSLPDRLPPADNGSRACAGFASVPLILGIGVNINHDTTDFSSELQEKATSLRLIAGRIFQPEDLFVALTQDVEHWFHVWSTQGFAPVREAWLQHNCTLGRTVRLPEGYGYNMGTALDMAPDGTLRVAVDGGDVVCIDSGEVMFSENRHGGNHA